MPGWAVGSVRDALYAIAGSLADGVAGLAERGVPTSDGGYVGVWPGDGYTVLITVSRPLMGGPHMSSS